MVWFIPLRAVVPVGLKIKEHLFMTELEKNVSEKVASSL